MKIAEVIGYVAAQEPEAARVSSFMQRIANAFTRGGRVKRPLGFQGSEEPATTVTPFASTPASGQGAAIARSVADAHTPVSTGHGHRTELRRGEIMDDWAKLVLPNS